MRPYEITKKGSDVDCYKANLTDDMRAEIYITTNEDLNYKHKLAVYIYRIKTCIFQKLPLEMEDFRFYGDALKYGTDLVEFYLKEERGNKMKKLLVKTLKTITNPEYEITVYTVMTLVLISLIASFFIPTFIITAYFCLFSFAFVVFLCWLMAKGAVRFYDFLMLLCKKLLVKLGE